MLHLAISSPDLSPPDPPQPKRYYTISDATPIAMFENDGFAINVRCRSFAEAELL
jgi:hypothetical protein